MTYCYGANEFFECEHLSESCIQVSVTNGIIQEMKMQAPIDGGVKKMETAHVPVLVPGKGYGHIGHLGTPSTTILLLRMV